MLTEQSCRETVSLPKAILFGAGDACVSVGTGSLLGGVVVFILAVVVLKTVLALAVRHAFSHRKALKADRASPLARDGGTQSDSLFSRNTPLPAPRPTTVQKDSGPIKSFD